MNTGDPAELVELTEKYPGTPVAKVVALTAADLTLYNGCEEIFKNKTKGSKKIGDAALIYENLLNTLRHPFLVAQTQYGLARTKECQNKLSEARELYKTIVKDQPNGPFGFLAADRLADLERPATQEILGKFASWTPDVFSDETGELNKLPKILGGPTEPLIEHDSFGKKFNQGESKDKIKSEDFLKDSLLPSTDVLPPPDEKKDETKPSAPESTTPAPATPEPAKPAENQPVALPVENK
jgi:hypothetical protein